MKKINIKLLILIGATFLLLSCSKKKQDNMPIQNIPNSENMTTNPNPNTNENLNEYGNYEQMDERNRDQQNDVSQMNQQNQFIRTNISEAEAIKIALGKSGGGIVVRYSLDLGYSGIRHKIKIIRGDDKYQIKILDETKELVEFSKKRVSYNKTESSIKNMLSNTKISLEEAKKIAINRVNGGIIKEYELEFDHGSIYYELEVINGTTECEMKIDAYTGEIFSLKCDMDVSAYRY